jgi:hypothetical protein
MAPKGAHDQFPRLPKLQIALANQQELARGQHHPLGANQLGFVGAFANERPRQVPPPGLRTTRIQISGNSPSGRILDECEIVPAVRAANELVDSRDEPIRSAGGIDIRQR